MSEKRTYTMGARAAAKEVTRHRILRAFRELAKKRMTIEITLDDVAERARTTVQTVLRHFGSRDGLFDAALAIATAEVEEQRRAPAGDTEAALRAIVDHYDDQGDFVLRMLAQEDDERIQRIVGPGKAQHRRWVQEVFAPQLRHSSDPEALTDALVVATDVYAWKLLRRDRALSRDDTERRMRTLVEAVLAYDSRP